jgi:hypothetical protein
MSVAKKAKYNELDLNEKIEVLDLIDKNDLTYAQIAKKYSISKGTVSNIKAKKDDYRAAWEANQSLTIKRVCIKKNKNYDINTLIIIVHT